MYEAQQNSENTYDRSPLLLILNSTLSCSEWKLFSGCASKHPHVVKEKKKIPSPYVSKVLGTQVLSTEKLRLLGKLHQPEDTHTYGEDIYIDSKPVSYKEYAYSNDEKPIDLE